MNLGIFDLVGVIMLVLAGTSFIYLLRVKNKTESTRMLIWFFLCVILSSIATITTNLGIAWDWAFAPSQDALLILGGVFLVRFAYLYPTNDRAKEARWVFTFFSTIALAAIAYAVIFAIRYIANLPVEISESPLYYLLTPIMISLAVLVFFRRSIHCSAQVFPGENINPPPSKSVIRLLIKPINQPALALRNYGLSLALGLIPVVVVVVKTSLPPVFASFLFNFGAVAAIAAVMLTYFNFAPESVTLSAKLVGISLVSFLFILGLAGVWIYESNLGVDVSRLVFTFISLVLLSSFLIIFTFPLFFRTAILGPLENLLQGVKIANEGDLNVQVAVQYDDEIGYLTQSFNRMITSLNEAQQALIDESEVLEKQVAERTSDLQYLNLQLINENIERKATQAMLDRQLQYEHALAGCSQSLLVTTDNEDSQKTVLTQALDHLRIGAVASRAYIFRNRLDDDLGLCMSMLAEACASEITPQIHNPENLKFPWSQLPIEMSAALGRGSPFGGPVKQVFGSTPQLLNAFLNQPEPLLSVQTFPIILDNQWWGFIGFDDCETPREWDEEETLMLRTASEMIQNTLRRWDAEKYLREALENLEQRVYQRTIDLSQAIAELNHEVHERRRFQDELEERLKIEKTLARISTRLLSPIEVKEAISATLADLGAIVQSNRVLFIQFMDNKTYRISEIIEWHRPATPPPDDIEIDLKTGYPGFCKLFDGHKSLFIENQLSSSRLKKAQLNHLFGSQPTALTLTPLLLENHINGVIICVDPALPKFKTIENFQLIEVVAGLLSSLLRREAILLTLEEKIAERTRELSAFFDMTMLSGQAQDLADILQPALVKVMETSSSEAGVIYLYEPDQLSLKLIAMRGIPSNKTTALENIALDATMLNWIESVSPDSEIEPLNPAMLPGQLIFSDFLASTHIILRSRGKKQGLMSCYRQENLPYDPYLTALLVAIGEQLGMAIENYRLRLKAREIATIEERNRLARELHDAVSQSLYSLTLFARSGRDAYDSGDRNKLLDSLEQLESNSLIALREMRLLLYQLRSLALEKGSLLEAVESRFNLVERRSGTQATIIIDRTIKFSDNVEQELFLIITEALNNALKHAGASQVSVSILPLDNHVVLTVWNNGKTFDPTSVQRGMGLQNMHERALSLGGNFSLTSQEESGTCIRIELPFRSFSMGEGKNE